jgi:GAF domain-containing protein
VSPVAPGGGPSVELVNTVIAWALILICSVISRHLVQGVERATYLARRNAILLQATTELGQAATNIRDINQLFTRAVELIQDRLGFYHVQVFLVRGDQAELVASTGKVGERLLANRHRLMVGSNSVIGRVTRDGRLVIARDTDADAVHHRNPLLPDTRAELAVPVFDGERVAGALDMQSTQRDSFHPEDVDAIESMATLLSAAIRNVRLFEAQERSVREQQRLYREAETNLREIQRLNRQLTRSGWDNYVEQANSATGVTLHDNEIVSATGWNEHLAAAARTRETVVQEANGKPGVVAVPVIVRGEVIGAIEVEPGEGSDPDASVEMMRAVAERLATSLENARLFEDAQAATAQEQLINQVVTRFQATSSVDDLLRITLAELSTALGAQRGAIRLGLISDENGDTGS